MKDEPLCVDAPHGEVCQGGLVHYCSAPAQAPQLGRRLHAFHADRGDSRRIDLNGAIPSRYSVFKSAISAERSSGERFSPKACPLTAPLGAP